MLVIRRRPGESITLGEDIEIQILDSSASHVKLGIRAPKSVVVVRTEIRLVGEQNRASAQGISTTQVENLLQTLIKPPSEPISPM
jgi:carbon storage regulator